MLVFQNSESKGRKKNNMKVFLSSINFLRIFLLSIYVQLQPAQKAFPIELRKSQSGSKKKVEGGEGGEKRFLLSPPPPPSFNFFLLLSLLSRRTSRGNACYAGQYNCKVLPWLRDFFISLSVCYGNRYNVSRCTKEGFAHRG